MMSVDFCSPSFCYADQYVSCLSDIFSCMCLYVILLYTCAYFVLATCVPFFQAYYSFQYLQWHIYGLCMVLFMSWERLLCHWKDKLCRGNEKCLGDELLCRGNEILCRWNEKIVSRARDMSLERDDYVVGTWLLRHSHDIINQSKYKLHRCK